MELVLPTFYAWDANLTPTITVRFASVSQAKTPSCLLLLTKTSIELAFLAIDPKIQVIAPWRIPEFYSRFQGRNDLLDYAAATNIPVTSTKAKPYSMDDNIGMTVHNPDISSPIANE